MGHHGYISSTDHISSARFNPVGQYSGRYLMILNAYGEIFCRAVVVSSAPNETRLFVLSTIYQLVDAHGYPSWIHGSVHVEIGSLIK